MQICFIGAVGYAIAVSLGFSAAAATPIAAAVALSSTVLLVRLLGQQGNRRDAHGQWALGIALVQDLVAVPVLVVLPQLGDTTGAALAEDVLIASAKGIGMVIVVLAVGRFVVPWFLGQALANRSRELFLISVFALASGVALGSFAAGLSVAFGAFLAGIVTAQSIYATRALQEVVPLRDLFAATFFVSIGVLFDLDVVVDEWRIFLAVLLWGGLGKVALIFALARWSGFDAKRSLRTGLLLGQVGEFSFLFAEATSGSAGEEASGILIATGAASMAISAALIGQADRIERGLLRIPKVRDWWTFEPVAEVEGERRQHTVIAGFGHSGQEVAHALTARDFSYLVVDSDPALPARARAAGVPFIWGDLANAATMDEAGLDHARMLLLTIADSVVSEMIVRQARADHPRLRIVARADNPEAAARLLDAGANAVVQPLLEIGLELTYQALHGYGVPSNEIRQAQARRRRES
ncbi:MAG: monovalent cation:H+ antiporter-2, CPA2 family [Chloroflexi bacterium]|nr:MAG: monovalent cation:H+ antiporter-2, CPA2 family [Chloroflexota bacterium]